MKIAPVADVKAHFSSYLEQCADGPIIITRNGHPTAVLVAVSDEAELDRLVLAYTPKFRALLDAAYERIRNGEGLTHDELWSAAGKKPE